ncbi:MAG: hypothetical protein MUC85_05125 [Anaerolineales bacterium]|nr:hypothetical protein [Anaerolineales bacterium]
MNHRKLLCSLFFLAVIFLLFPGSALADIAPPTNPPGSNIEPGSEPTQVRMVAEKVVVEVYDDGLAQGLGKAHVTADFTMQNLGSEPETMQVRFPMSANDGFGNYPQITNVTVKVDEKTMQTSVASYAQPDGGLLMMPWVEFAVTFPPEEPLLITVEYDLLGSGYYPFTAFYYLLETGAGWKGTIGSAEIILRLPYEANSLNVVQDFQIGWAETNQGAAFEGHEVHWFYEDFEPEPYSVVQNMEFVLVAPGAWKKVLVTQAAVKASPTDGEAWGRLAKAYKDLFLLGRGYREDFGGEELFRLSVEAYEKCLQLKPNDAQWHAGFADLLANRSYWDSWTSGPTNDAIRALDEIQTALRIAPNDAKVKEIAVNISWLFPDGMTLLGSGFDFPWLTQTPTPWVPTATQVSPTATAAPSATPTPEQTDLPEMTQKAATQEETLTPQRSSVPEPSPEGTGPSLPCASAILAPLIALAWLWWRRWK